MTALKRIAGIVWILLGPLAVFFLIRTASLEIAAKPSADTWIQWGVFVLVFLPIAFGLSLFGYYAIQGEYDQED
ncbi:MAG: hypothetical protein IBJ16_12545 [Chitinophagaceae bacterium]|nr:hypothetical protein [Chitinophagaceae bacterium]